MRAYASLLCAVLLGLCEARKKYRPRHSGGCPKAVSIYAMQKTGSTFLGRFSRDVTLRNRMCKAYQNTKEFICETILYVDCPRNAHHKKSVHLEQGFRSVPFKPDGKPVPGPEGRCTATRRQEMFAQANDWLRGRRTSVKYRYNFSLHELLSAEGFVRGPLRQLYVEAEADAVPTYQGYHNVYIVHTRHPVEMMVSAYYCIANRTVCPVRSKFLGSHVPKNDTITSVDDFVLAGIKRPGSTPHSILKRTRQIAKFIQEPHLREAPADGASPCPSSKVIHSQYERMVTNFTQWSAELLPYMVTPGKGGWRSLHKHMVDRYKNDFVPDGKHKQTLRKGANIAKLRRSTIDRLVRDVELSSVLRQLGYDWFGHDRGAWLA